MCACVIANGSNICHRKTTKQLSHGTKWTLQRFLQTMTKASKEGIPAVPSLLPSVSKSSAPPLGVYVCVCVCVCVCLCVCVCVFVCVRERECSILLQSWSMYVTVSRQWYA